MAENPAPRHPPAFLGRLTQAVRQQNWFAVGLEVVIVIVGVFLGIQIGNWNEARLDAHRREQIVGALMTTLNDAIAVQQRFVSQIDAGLEQWESGYEDGELAPPFHYRIDGSDTAPDVWSTFEQMELTELFDPVTLFDLAFFYSELEGVGRKYVRYVAVVEQDVLPGIIAGPETFYDAAGRLRPHYRANMDRLREYRDETEILTHWARCLIYRLGADRDFDETCRRAGYRLEGMGD